MSNIATRFAHFDGRLIAYAVTGQGPAIVCPAWWVSHVAEDWEDPHIRRFFESLSAHFTVLRYDQLGVGMSDGDRTAQSLDEGVAVLTAVIDAAGLDRVSLFGWSSGGPIAVGFAARHPERVERMVLCGTFVRGADVGDPAVRAAMLQLIEAHWGLGSTAMTDIFVPDCDDDVKQRFLRSLMGHATQHNARALLELMYSYDATELAAAVRAPTLVVHRRRDRAIPLDAGRRLAASIPGAELATLDGRDHPPWEGAPDVLARMSEYLLGAAIQPVATAPCYVDESTRELVVDDDRRSLSKLEYGLLTYLMAKDAVVSRDELLEQVWQQPYSGSNVVDAVVASVRKKLGTYCGAIATITGHGYRFTGFEPRDS